jgi:sugar lactone lactonase YvrE
MGMAVDIEGNLFIVEPNQNRVRRVTPNGEISTVAGTGKEQGPLGDGGPARQATLLYPTGVAFDKAGNLYIADSGHFRVRKVSPSGEITTIAGTGREGSSGDGGPAIRARIYAAGVTVDAEGNVFIADANRVRKVDTQGIISTVVGTGVSGFGGDDAPAAAALIATMELEAPLAGPINIAMDSSGVLFIGDQKNYRIRSVNPKGIISTFAGNGTRGFSGDGGSALRAQFLAPRDIVVDPTGGFYVADSSNYRIRKVSPDGVVTTVVGNGDDGFSGDGGPATSAQLNYPDVLTVDASGDLLISDALNRRIRKVSRGVITTVAGNGVVGLASGDGGPAVAARLENPGGIALNLAGELFIADAFTRIRKVDKTGRITTIAGTGKDGTSGDGGLATSASIRAYMVLVDGDGNLFFSGTYGIRKIAPTGIITSVVGTPNGGAGFNGDNVPARAAQVNQPRGMAIGPDGNLYFADTDNHRIRKLTSDGTVITIAGTGVYGFGGDNGPAAEARLAAPVAIAFDREGNLLIADTNNNRIRKITFGR